MLVHAALITVTTALLHLSVVQSAPQSPHLIFIVADDLGWNDVGYHNPDIISPNIDKLAGSGIRLNQSYVQPLCSPSRSAFMTGVYPFRMGLQHMVIGESQDVCAPLNRKFFPQILKENGYMTHMIGKWHLGFCKWECTPTYRGFDSFYGFYSGGEDYYTHVYPNGYDYRYNLTVNTEAAGNYSTYEFAARAEQIIQDHDQAKPLYLYMPFQSVHMPLQSVHILLQVGTHMLYLYMPFQSVHMPLQVPDKYLEMYPNIKNKNRKALSAMVTSLDDAIGRVVTALQDKDMYQNSIIVFTADNGGWTIFGGNNYPLRGGKVTIFEGGTRAAAFIHSPLLKQTGVIYDGMMHAVDWFPTLASALGITYNDSLDQDGVDQWEAITTLAPSKRSEIVYNMDYHPAPVEGQSAIRFGDYKLIEGYPGLYQGWYKPDSVDQGVEISAGQLANMTLDTPAVQELMRSGQPQSLAKNHYLFNLKDDPTEHNNLYDKLPEVVQQLQERLAEQRKRYVPPNFPPNSPKANPKHFGGVWSPGWC
ncbi:hypothetical protein RRG08_045129 [Elysia crispata]|uniref:Sulfatase N-terminal domain-containing protein n=1 Tax=Elysia crispata TaxID=231223 RepID=A0AAE1D463_9GAST|nr:hypothetical protein RRG08_045129 [Elysia crispata]